MNRGPEVWVALGIAIGCALYAWRRATVISKVVFSDDEPDRQWVRTESRRLLRTIGVFQIAIGISLITMGGGIPTSVALFALGSGFVLAPQLWMVPIADVPPPIPEPEPPRPYPDLDDPDSVAQWLDDPDA